MTSSPLPTSFLPTPVIGIWGALVRFCIGWMLSAAVVVFILVVLLGQYDKALIGPGLAYLVSIVSFAIVGVIAAGGFLLGCKMLATVDDWPVRTRGRWSAGIGAISFVLVVLVFSVLPSVFEEGVLSILTLILLPAFISGGTVAVIGGMKGLRRTAGSVPCPRCGFDLRASTGSSRCPECGEGLRW